MRKILSLLLTLPLLLLAERGMAQYCAAGATDTPQNEKISNVSFNTINNTSTGGDGYENFTSISTTVEREKSYTFTGSIAVPFQGDQIIVWIDYNHDFDFEDAWEQVFISPTGVGPHSGVITIPATATLGATRMRVRLHDTLNLPNNTPCGNSKYGQVEDYTINIVACTGANPGNTLHNATLPICANTAFTLSLQNSSPSGTTYQWQSSPNNTTWTDISGATSTTYASLGISTSTWYRCRATFCSIATNSTALQMNVASAPITGLTITSVASPVCPNTTFTLSLEYSQPSGTTYQWQSSSDGTTWTDISGATNATQVITGINAFTWYRCRVSRCGFTTNSNSGFMAVQTLPNPGNTITSLGPPVCPSTAFTLSLQNTQPFSMIFQWQSSPNGSTWTNINGATFQTLDVTGITSTTWYRCQVTRCTTIISTPLQMIVSAAPNPGNTISNMGPPVCASTAFTLSLQNSQPNGTTYQWQSSPNNSTWTDISGATSATYASAGIMTATWFRCRATLCSTVNSTALQMNLQPCYCVAGANTQDESKISNVSFSTINNTSSSSAGYENFTAISTSVQQGTAYAFTATQPNNWPYLQIIVWIDFNQDLDFDDAGETVLSTSTGIGPFTGSILIPINAPLGATRMRVRLNDTAYGGSNTTPCGNSENGQVEDYTVNIVACSGSPNPGNTISSVTPPVCPSTAFTLSLQNSQPSGTTYQWQSSPDNSTWTNIGGATNATYASTGIATATWFRCQVSWCTTVNSSPLQVTVFSAPNPGNTISSVTPPVCPSTAFTLSLQNSQPSGTTYQWQSSPNNSTWTDISGATSATYSSTGITTSTWYRCRATLCNVTTNSTALQMTMQTCYCTAGANTQDASKISNVSFSTINNSSSSSAGYENFTAISTNVEQGTAYAFTATQPNNWAYLQIIVWIDFNQDLDFDDAGETILSTSTGTGPFTGSIGIPFSATVGATRMRVRLNDTAYGGSNATPCGNSENGQVEDYTVNILACSSSPNPGNTISSVTPPVCPSTAFTLSLQNSQQSGTTYQWQSSPDNSTWTNIGGATGATYASTGIATATWFRCQVSWCTTVNSSPLQVTVAPAPNPGNTISSVTPPVCPSTAFTLSLQNSQPSGTTYQWQSSPDNSTWTDISGATSATYASTGITTATWYRCQVIRCSTVYSTALQVTVSATPNPGNTVSSVGLPVCPSSAFNLNIQNSQPSGTTYQWQSSPNNSTWTDISGATSATYSSTGITTSTWYRCRATLCSTTNSTALQVTVATTPNPGSTFSNQTLPLCPSSPFTASLQNSQPSGTIYQWQSSPDNSAWTDISGATNASYTSAGITTDTWYRCRATLCSVSTNSTPKLFSVATAPNPGNTLSDVAPPVCTASESFTLSLQNAQQPGSTYQWQFSLNNSTWTTINGATTATRTVTGINNITWYRCQVTKCGITVASTPLQMTIESCYCTAGATNTQSQYEKIAYITFNTINNASSGTSGYEDFTAVSTDLEQGSSYVFTGTSSNSYAQDEMIVWIDFNQDLDFTDSGEKVFDSANGTGPYASSITIPLNSLTGTTRMRVRLHDTSNGPNSTSCGNSTFGQVEDYTVNITLPSAYRTWVGGSGNWNVAANWSPAILPTSSNPVFISTGAPTIPASYAATAAEVAISNTADLIIGAGATLTVQSVTTHSISIQGAGSSLQNTGTITITGSGANTHGIYVASGGSLTNQGTINIPYTANLGLAGIYSNGGTVYNQSGGIISIDRSTGTYAGLAAIGGGTFTNEGLVNIGTDANAAMAARGINISGSGTSGTNSVTGTINIARCGSGWAGFSVESSAIFTNNGTMSIGIGGNIPGDGISATSTFLNNGNITIAPVSDKLIEGNATQFFSNNAGGSLKGTGNILASAFYNNGGSLKPGYSPGQMTFSAAEDFSNGAIEIEVNGSGTAGVDFDQIVVNGTANLGGTSVLNLNINFTPSGNQQIVILSATTLSGSFATINGLANGWSLLYNTPSTGKVSLNFAVLPIELIYFKGKAETHFNELEWATASEKNSQYHIVERSANGILGWQEIGRREAAGTSTKPHTYFLTDEQPLPIGYYRLKAVDFDGKYEYSNIVAIERAPKGLVITDVFPVPVSDVLTIRMLLDEPTTLSVVITDVTGKIVQASIFDTAAGEKDVQLDVSQLAAGVYFVHVNNGRESCTERMIKQN